MQRLPFWRTVSAFTASLALILSSTAALAEIPERRQPGANKTISFESASVRPMASSLDNQQLFATNTPDNALLVYSIAADGQLTQTHSVPVGLEPVALAVRPKLSSGVDPKEVWVVNHLSDSISIVDISTTTPYIKKTLLVGDEPRDIVFANDMAFITTARRGQQRLLIPETIGGGDPKLHEPSTPRADVWVFDAANPGSGLGGMPLKIINLFGDTPRALAVDKTGSTVYAAVFNSGNQTSIVHESVLCKTFQDYPNDRKCTTLDGKELPGGRTAPSTNKDGVHQPQTSMIVKYDPQDGKWKDSGGLDFSNGVRLNLPDKDVFAINTSTLEEAAAFTSVGTTLFNMVVNPNNGNVYVSNTDSNNATRFEGPGTWLRNDINKYPYYGPYRRIKDVPTTVQGNIAKARITVINPQSPSYPVTPVHLNPHIDYSKLKTGNNKAVTLATPTQMAINEEGSRLYVAALGSNKIAVYDTAKLDSGDPAAAQNSSWQISVEGGPAGILLNNNRIYAMTRFDNSIAVLDADSGQQLQTVSMFNPEPEKVQAGRFMLYDANRSSSNGEASCASCHVFGDADQLSWNLGNPDSSNAYNPLDHKTLNLALLGCSTANGGTRMRDDASCRMLQHVNGSGDANNVFDFIGNLVTDNLQQFSALKGPMSTQTMRGMSTHGALHWRGDRANGYFSNAMNINDERTSFRNFIVAFEGLLGMNIDLENRNSPEVQALSNDMDKFADFMLSVQLPPNPIRPLDNSFTPSAASGKDFFFGEGTRGRRSDGLPYDLTANDAMFPGKPDGVTCSGCHIYEPENGFYGADGRVAHGGEVLILKVPHFRNLYTRVGMFGLPDREGFLPSETNDLPAHQRDQVRGFGFLHDGATDMLFNFLKGGVFDDGETDCSNVNTGLNENLDASHGCNFNVGNVGIPDDQIRQSLVDFLMESDSDLAPVVGQQVTINKDSGTASLNRFNLLLERSLTPFKSKVMQEVLARGGDSRPLTECELIAQGQVNGEYRSYLFDGTQFTSDKASEAAISEIDLLTLAHAGTNSLTFSCVPPGSGEQMALDKDLDGYLNRDELLLGSNPADPYSLPQASL